MTNILQRQGQLILKSQNYAFCLTALLITLPMTAWLALAVLMFVTLRRGYQAGSRVLAASVFTLLFAYYIGYVHRSFFIDTLSVFGVGFFAACVLRVSASWKILASILLMLGLFIICSMYVFAPAYINEQFDLLTAFLRAIGANNALELMVSQSMDKPFLINYIFGIKVVGLFFSVISSLLVARHIQSSLFYPGAFKQEISDFRSSSFAVLGLVLAILGIYNASPLAIACLPLICIYFMASGVCLMVSLINNTKKSLLFLVIPIMIVPYVMLPAYVVLGIFDSIVNVRLRLQQGRKLRIKGL